MSKVDPQIVVKLQLALQKLSTSIDPERSKVGSSFMIEDDTTLQKLHTYIDNLMRKSGNELAWAQNTGLIEFIHRSIDLNVVSIPDNASLVAFAIKAFGSLLSTEEAFNFFAEDKVLMDFYIIWPNLRNDPTLASAALDLLGSLLNHNSGLAWLLKNGVWEKLLLPSLRSTSIFVQRKGVKVITSLLLLVVDSQHFEALVKDLLLVSDKFCEIRQHVDRTLSEEIRQSSLHVLFIFKELYIKTLGKTSLYTKLSDIGDMRGRLLSMIEKQVPVTFVTHVVDLVILDAMHNFQEKMMEYGIIEQFLVDTLCADVIALVKLVFDKGHIESFFRSSVNVHKYWMVLVTNIDESKQVYVKDQEALLHLVTSFQVIPVTVLSTDFISQYPCKKGLFESWIEGVHCRINIKESLRVEASKMENQIMATLRNDSSLAVKLAVVTISSASSAADILTLGCAVTIFQGLVFMLCMAVEHDTSVIRHQGELQRMVVVTLRVLVEKFEIDWRKCFVSICLMYVLCSMLTVPNISTQVKVLTLKAIKTSIVGFVPPVMAMLVNSEDQHMNGVEQMGIVLAGCLADTEWEVRDSALEVVITCMTLGKHKYPFFVDWFLRYNLDTIVLAALEDIEGYVRASAFSVMACIVCVDQVWVKLEEENLQHRALASVLWEGDTPVRKSALSLVIALYSAGKFSEDSLNDLVVNIVQRSTEDVDDEVRSSALEFIHIHIKESLHKSGMVDGEFPAVTFSKGKITKLDKHEVQKRVLSIINWICDSGYLNCLLLCLNDPVTNVAEKAQQIFCCLSDLINKYDVRAGGHGAKRLTLYESREEHKRKGCLKQGWLGLLRMRRNYSLPGVAMQFVFDKRENSSRKTYDKMDTEFKTSPKVESTEQLWRESFVEVAGQNIKVTEDVQELDDIDKTISDILHSSTLDNVSSIKRPPDNSYENSKMNRKNIVLTIKDVPLRSSAIPIEYLLQSLNNICRHTIIQGDMTVVNLLSLLDDILLDGCKTELPDADDQHLRDCY